VSNIKYLKNNKFHIFFSILFWLAFWQIASLLVAKKILLVSPVDTIKRLFELSLTLNFWTVVANSLSKIGLGFLFACLVGAALAVIASGGKFLYSLIKLPLNVINATPIVSFIILALLWIKARNLSMFISFIMVLPMIFFSVRTGILNVDKNLKEMATVFRLTAYKKARFIYVPSVMPYFITAASNAVGFAWKSGVAAEIVGLQRYSVGLELYQAKLYLETADVFAWTLVVIVLSLITEKGFKKLLRRLNHYVA